MPARFCLLPVILLALFACSPGAPERPHVVLISIDTLRADHVGSYGYERATTPTLDALAAESVRFDHAISAASWTLPSHMSVITSLRPSVHGVSQDRALDLGAETLAELLGEAGYRSAAWVSWVYLSPVFGFSQGFDEFNTMIDFDRVDMAGGGGALPADQVVDSAAKWLRGKGDEPLFLFVHLFDPHMDYAPPASHRELFGPARADVSGSYESLKPYILGLNPTPPRFGAEKLAAVQALYDAEIRFADDALAELLAAIDAELGRENCVIAVMSDHGEEFLDHGSMEGHGWTLYEEIVRVPLILRRPGPAAPRVVEAPVSLLDLAPTLCDLVGVAVPASFEGSSLLSLLDGGAARRNYAYSESDRFNVKRRSLRGARYKLIHTADSGVNSAGVPVIAGYELYDLSEDPGERRNLYREDEAQSQALRALLEEVTNMPPGAVTQNPAAELTPEQIELLRSLGYVQ